MDIYKIVVCISGRELTLTNCHIYGGDQIMSQSELVEALRNGGMIMGYAYMRNKIELINIPTNQIQYAYIPQSNILLESYIKEKVLEFVTFDDAVMNNETKKRVHSVAGTLDGRDFGEGLNVRVRIQ